MKKLPLVLGLSLLLVATPVFAKDNNQGNSTGHRFSVNVQAGDDGDSDKDDPTPSSSPNPSVSPNPSCSPDGHENHGEFVSCVARLHLGGDEVSEAAHSDIGKGEEEEEHEGASPSATPSMSPSPTPSASASAAPTPTPEATESASPSPTASGSAELLPNAQKTQVQNIITMLQGIINNLKSLLS